MATKTINKVVQADNTEDFERLLNEVNKEYGTRVFATQTSTVINPNSMKVICTAVFFIRNEDKD
jgi:hypothetical protein